MSSKIPMSLSYKAVFTLSILMIFVVIIGGAMSGSKSVGFGIWYWGYTAWKMYKRDNVALVLLQKVMLWFQAAAFSVALAVLMFSDSDITRYVDITPLGLLIVSTFSIGITFALYKFFKAQDFVVTSAADRGGYTIDDALWEQVSNELKSGKRVDALWARAFADADGDSNKANARYLKLRFDQLKSDSLKSSDVAKDGSSSKNITNIRLPFLPFWDNLNAVGKLAFVAIVLLIVYSLLGGDMDPFFNP